MENQQYTEQINETIKWFFRRSTDQKICDKLYQMKDILEKCVRGMQIHMEQLWF